ncbi:MAG: hypothetical protein ACKVVP_24370 [Chloroflexota bacterium]
MAEDSTDAPRIPIAQILLDDVVLILVAGLVVPSVFYLIWGLISLLTVPPLGG